MAGLENSMIPREDVNKGTGIKTDGFEIGGGFGGITGGFGAGDTGSFGTLSQESNQFGGTSSNKDTGFGVKVPEVAPSMSPENVDQRASTKADLEDFNGGGGEASIGSQFASAAAGAGQDILNVYLTNLRTAAENNYKSDADEWQRKRKGWFNPDTDVIPSLSEYLSGLPSATEMLTNTTATGGQVSDTDSSGVLLGIGTSGVSALFDDQKQAEYIWNKGGEGAAGGAMSSGWVGAIVGGLVGVLEGALSWASAEDQSEGEIRKRTAEYQEKYDIWLAQRKKRQSEIRTVQTQGIIDRKKETKTTKKSGIIGAMSAFGKGVIR